MYQLSTNVGEGFNGIFHSIINVQESIINIYLMAARYTILEVRCKHTFTSILSITKAFRVFDEAYITRVKFS